MRSVPVDVVLAVVLTSLTLVTFMEQRHGRAPWFAVVLVVLAVAPIALRQRVPVLALSVILGAMCCFALLDYGDFPDAGAGIMVGMFTVAMLRPRGVAALMFLATVCLAVLAYVLSVGEPVAWSQVGQVTLISSGVWVLGDSTKNWALRTERLAAEAARAASNERVRIARELHDIVSHHMSVISLQAGVAEYVLDEDPATARTAIATVGDASREALLDMRRLLEVLHVEPGSDPDGAAGASSTYRPQPGLAQLEELVNRTRNAGVPVDVSVTGHAFPLPPGTDLCAYRVVQESLTNVLKHAAPATARVEVDYGPHAVTVRISDTGRRVHRPRTVPRTSYGIRGMRERVELYGGVLTAEPAKGGGFMVQFRLPVQGVAR